MIKEGDSLLVESGIECQKYLDLKRDTIPSLHYSDDELKVN